MIYNDWVFPGGKTAVGFVGISPNMSYSEPYAIVMFDPDDKTAREFFEISEQDPYCKVPLRKLRPFPEEFNRIFEK